MAGVDLQFYWSSACRSVYANLWSTDNFNWWRADSRFADIFSLGEKKYKYKITHLLKNNMQCLRNTNKCLFIENFGKTFVHVQGIILISHSPRVSCLLSNCSKIINFQLLIIFYIVYILRLEIQKIALGPSLNFCGLIGPTTLMILECIVFGLVFNKEKHEKTKGPVEGIWNISHFFT